MENIGYPRYKGFQPEFTPDLRTLDELLRLVELRLEELERRISLVEVHGGRGS